MSDIPYIEAPRPFVGVFDSGAGGISVLGALVAELPQEDFIYFGDSAHTPYGEKPAEWVVARSLEIAHALADVGAKALVIACNTATAVAAFALREAFDELPIIGIEPALKPATHAPGMKRILVMATPNTLRHDKYHELEHEWSGERAIETVECPGLAARIEQGHLDAPDLREQVERLVGSYRGQVDGVVLGCTHYPFIAPVIRQVLGDVALFDGARGTARQLHRKLIEAGMLAPAQQIGSVRFETSGERSCSLTLYEEFLKRACSMKEGESARAGAFARVGDPMPR